MATPQAPSAPTTPESTPPTEPTVVAQEQQEEKPITRRELDEAIEAGFRRAQQSSKARALNIETKVNELTEQLKNLSIPVTPEITAKLRERAESEVDQPPTQPGESLPPGNPVYDWTMALYKEEGLDIKPADPEWAAVKAALDDPDGNMVKYQRIVMKAIETKRTRQASEQDAASARVAGGQTSSSGAVTKSTRQLWADAHKK